MPQRINTPATEERSIDGRRFGIWSEDQLGARIEMASGFYGLARQPTQAWTDAAERREAAAALERAAAVPVPDNEMNLRRRIAP